MNVFIDMDGTLCDDRHRSLLAQAKLWDEYHERIPDDGINDGLAQIMRALAGVNINIIGLTSRPERYRAPTITWCAHNDIFLDVLLMRPADNYKSSPVVKLAMLAEFYEFDMDMALAKTWGIFEDRDDVCEALRNEGFNVFQSKISVRKAI